LSEIKPQYESVRIGNQEWMTINLDVDKFRNGDLIPHIESDKEWEKAEYNSQPAWCYYDNNPEKGKKYGKLYNWFAVNDPRGLAPLGWYIPTDEEWNCLVEFLGKDACYKMKSVHGWPALEDEDGKIQNWNGDNSSGFNALPGARFLSGGIYEDNMCTFFWSVTEDDTKLARGRCLTDNYKIVDSDVFFKDNGLSVRCIKNSSDAKWAQAIRAGNIKPYIPPGLKLK